MAALNLGAFLELTLRWLHVVAAILWIGQVYFFNFAFVHAFPLWDGPTIQKVNPSLLGRVLWWFKWSATVTLLAGLALYARIYLWTGEALGNNGMLHGPDGMTGRSYWIHLGVLLGVLMWALTWFGIAPVQARVLERTANGGPPPSPAEMRRIKLGVPIMYLSGPAVFGMLGASHYSAVNVLFFVAIALALGLVHLAYLYAAKVKGFEN